MFLPEKILKGNCPECNKKVTYNSKELECECFLNWNHVIWGSISDDEYRNVGGTIWYCRKCIAIREQNKSVRQAQLFLRYVDDIVRAVNGCPEKDPRGSKFITSKLLVHNRGTKHEWEIEIFGFTKKN